MTTKPIRAHDVEGVPGQTNYPAAFRHVVAGRTKRKLGDRFELESFGVNLTHLEPGSASALYHWHAVQDEFVYILEGNATVIVGEEEHEVGAGDCIGFKSGTKIGHQIVNRSDSVVSYLEIGDRLPGDHGCYPNDDMVFEFQTDSTVVFAHKNGAPY